MGRTSGAAMQPPWMSSLWQREEQEQDCLGTVCGPQVPTRAFKADAKNIWCGRMATVLQSCAALLGDGICKLGSTFFPEASNIVGAVGGAPPRCATTVAVCPKYGQAVQAPLRCAVWEVGHGISWILQLFYHYSHYVLAMLRYLHGRQRAGISPPPLPATYYVQDIHG